MKPDYTAPDDKWLATDPRYANWRNDMDCHIAIKTDAHQNAADKLRLMAALEALCNAVDSETNQVTACEEARALLQQMKEKQ